jgi:hypothetical protein
MTVSASTPSRCISLISMAACHWRIGRKTLGHLCKKETREPLIKDSPSTTKEVSHQIMVAAAAEAHTYSNLRIACSMVVRQTIAQKIAPYSSSTKEKWSKTPQQSARRGAKHTMKWALSHQQYSPSYHLLFPPHAYQNSQGQALAYYQSYHYVTTNRHKFCQLTK